MGEYPASPGWKGRITGKSAVGSPVPDELTTTPSIALRLPSESVGMRVLGRDAPSRPRKQQPNTGNTGTGAAAVPMVFRTGTCGSKIIHTSYEAGLASRTAPNFPLPAPG